MCFFLSTALITTTVTTETITNTVIKLLIPATKPDRVWLFSGAVFGLVMSSSKMDDGPMDVKVDMVDTGSDEGQG